MMKFDSNGKQRVEAYQGTFDTFCAEDMLGVEKIKTYVKSMNAELRSYQATDKRGNAIQFRVCVKGRKPINKVLNRRTGNMIGHTGHGDVIGGMANAAAVDVYIQRRWTEWN
jgi:hypothetical protein|tara:strand:- start:2206 stop:2541 length:336 start_codon:yes stop_codon:yes gene_type:complete